MNLNTAIKALMKGNLKANVSCQAGAAGHTVCNLIWSSKALISKKQAKGLPEYMGPIKS